MTDFIHSFIHSFWLFLKRLSKSTTTQRHSRLQHLYCIGVSRRSAQATVCKGFAQGPYVAARAGVEPTTLRLKVIHSTNVPPRPTRLDCLSSLLCSVFDSWLRELVLGVFMHFRK